MGYISAANLVLALAVVAVGWAIIKQLNRLIEREKLVADTLQQLDSAISGLGTGITQLIADTQALITAVQNIPGQDFSSEVDAINDDIANLQSLDTSVTGETGTLGGGSQAQPQAGPGQTLISHPVTGLPTVVDIDPATGQPKPIVDQTQPNQPGQNTGAAVLNTPAAGTAQPAPNTPPQ